MGDVVLGAFGVLAVIGIALIGVGALFRARVPMVLGAALLLGLAGAWVLGLPGTVFGVIPLAYLWRRRSSAPAKRG